MWTIFKVFIRFVTILLLLYVLFSWLRGGWDLYLPHQGSSQHLLPWKATFQLVDHQGSPRSQHEQIRNLTTA